MKYDAEQILLGMMAEDSLFDALFLWEGEDVNNFIYILLIIGHDGKARCDLRNNKRNRGKIMLML